MFSWRPSFFILILLFPIRLLAQNVAPVVTAAITDATLFENASAEVIPLEDHFNDPDTSGVRLTTVLGNVDIALYDQRTPITVANFKNYINSGRYFLTDPTDGHLASLFVHRLTTAGKDGIEVVQSGGFLSTVDPQNPAQVLPTQVTAFSPIKNEPGISNTRGTIAMAKLGTDPDSATSQWYINYGDNPGLDDPSNDGGFTVFGRVIGTGMTAVDGIAALPIFNFGSPFDSMPVRDFTSGVPMLDNLITIPGISYVTSLTFTASSDHPAIATATLSGSNLLVSGKLTGSAMITVTATDADGAQVSTTFTANVIANPVHLANISTRAVVGTDDGALIGGFIVRGDGPKKVIVRAIGPSLQDAGITDFLADPTLEIHDTSGAIIASNDNWQTDANSQGVIDAGIAPTDPKESAILLTLDSDDVGIGYTAVVHGANNGTGVGLVEVYDVDSGPSSSVLNISTRADVGTGDNVLIGGFIVFGEGDQQVLVRAIGPSLAGAVPNPLADPTLTLVNGQGTQLDFNDNWQDNPDEAEIEATTIPPSDPKESAVIQTLSPGNYTAIVKGAGVTPTGTGLVEVYALQPTSGAR